MTGYSDASTEATETGPRCSASRSVRRPRRPRAAPISAMRGTTARAIGHAPRDGEREPDDDGCRRDTGHGDRATFRRPRDLRESTRRRGRRGLPPRRRAGALRHLARHRRGVRSERDERDRGDGEHYADDRRRTGALARAERVAHRDDRSDHRRHRSDEADQARLSSRCRTATSPRPTADAAPCRPRHVGARDAPRLRRGGPRGSRVRSPSPARAPRRGRAHGAREEAAEEVGAADQERRGDREERGHASVVARGRRPGGPAPLEEGAQPFLALLARAPLGDAARRLGAVGTLEHEPLGVARGARPGGAELAEDPLERRRRGRRPPRARARSASAVAASKRSPVTK